MLWEADDPAEQLTRRFGFHDRASAAEWVADALQGHWDLDVTGCDRLVISAWNVMAWVATDDRRLIAKWSALPQRFAHLVDAARVATWLDTCGIPVAAPIPATDGRLLVEFGNEAKGRLRSRLSLPGRQFLLGVLPVVEGESSTPTTPLRSPMRVRCWRRFTKSSLPILITSATAGRKDRNSSSTTTITVRLREQNDRNSTNALPRSSRRWVGRSSSEAQ